MIWSAKELLKHLTISSIIITILVGISSTTVLSQTIDPTYVRKTTGLPFAKSSPQLQTTPPNYMKHMVIGAKSVHAEVGAAQFIGIETLTNPTLAKVKILPGAATVLLVDFGQELAGRLQIWGTNGVQITITTGESKEECVHVEPALDNSGPFKLTLTGTEPVSTPYSGFRYARIVFPENTPVDLTRIICDHKYYPVQYWGSFNCSDPLLTRIWYTGAYTVHLCMQEEIWDAPKRDRGLWIGDLQVIGQTVNNVFADRFMMEHSIAKVREGAQGKRLPTELPVSDVNKIPGYSASWFCTLADFHRHVGDQEFLVQQHEKIISLLKYQQTLFDDQDIFVNPQKEWAYCDWSPGFVLSNPLTLATSHLYIILGVREAVYLLHELGDVANADKYSAWADKLVAAARAKFMNPETHTYSNRIQQNIMAVLSGTAKTEQCAEIYKQVIRPGSPAWTVEPDRTRHDDDPITPYYGYFLLQTMEKMACYQDGIDWIRSYWGEMLRRGATTWWEKFDPSWPDDMNFALNNTNYMSLSHGWSSGPTTYLTETVLGVRPTGAGFSKVDICPELGDLKWAEGDVPTPNGLIHIRIDRKKDQLTAIVKLPPQVVATMKLAGKTYEFKHAGTFRMMK